MIKENIRKINVIRKQASVIFKIVQFGEFGYVKRYRIHIIPVFAYLPGYTAHIMFVCIQCIYNLFIKIIDPLGYHDILKMLKYVFLRYRQLSGLSFLDNILYIIRIRDLAR